MIKIVSFIAFLMRLVKATCLLDLVDPTVCIVEFIKALVKRRCPSLADSSFNPCLSSASAWSRRLLREASWSFVSFIFYLVGNFSLYSFPHLLRVLLEARSHSSESGPIIRSACCLLSSSLSFSSLSIL